MGEPVLIVGGGPAGAAAAIALARRGVAVQLFEPALRGGNKLCETLYPEAGELLRRLGLDAFETKPLTASYVGRDGQSRLRLSVSAGIGSIDRNKLDSGLRLTAADAGAELIELKVDRIETAGGQPVVQSQGKSYRGAYVIDASGKNPLSLPGGGDPRSAVLDRRFNAFSHFERAGGFAVEDWTIVSMPNGFAYVLPVRAHRICVGIVSYAVFGTPDIEATYVNLFHTSEFLVSLTRGARRVLPIISARNQQTDNQPLAEHGIVRTGDALGFTDPFLWDGLGFALETGEAAGRLCADAIDRGKGDFHGYGDFVRAARARARRHATDHCDGLAAQFNPAMMADPHVSPVISGCLFSLMNDASAGGLASLRKNLSSQGSCR